jgi:hypothetical protein
MINTAVGFTVTQNAHKGVAETKGEFIIMSQDQLKFAVLEYLKGLKTEGGADGQALDTALTSLRWVQSWQGYCAYVPFEAHSLMHFRVRCQPP